MRIYSLTVKTVVLLILIYYSASSQYNIINSTFGSGASRSEGSSVVLQGTVGQPLSGISENATSSVLSGFWFAVQSGLVTSVDDRDGEIPSDSGR